MNLACKRIILSSDALAHRTAGAELAAWMPATLAALAEPGPGDAVLAEITHPIAAAVIAAGLTDLHDRDPAKDPFHVLTRDGVLWLLGGSQRGLLNAVHAVIGADWSGPFAELDLRGSFAFSHRIFSPLIGGTLHDPATDQDGIRRSIRYLSRMGASHVAATHDFSGGATRDLHAYVASSVFPLAAPEGQRMQQAQRLREIIDASTAYGLGVLFDARLLPCQGGPWVAPAVRAGFLTRFPAEVQSSSGTYQGQVLCFGHPQVRAFLAEVVQRFCAAFPEIGLFHVLTQDAEGEFCDPHTCPRCRGLGRFDQRDRLSRFLADALGRARPGAVLLNTGFQWDREETGMGQLIARQAALPAAVGLCLAATGDSATFERQSHDQLRQARAATARAGQLLIGRDATHVFEDGLFQARQRFDYPLGIFAKIRRWRDLGCDGFYDVRGRQGVDDLHANALAVRAALLEPGRDPRAFVRGLSERWFGSSAGPLVDEGWRLIERAQAIRSNAYAFPSSSPLSEYAPWHFGRAFTPVADEPRFTGGIIPQGAPYHGELEPAAGNGLVYRSGTYPQRLEAVGLALCEAAGLLAVAAERLAEAGRRPLPDSIAEGPGWLGGGAAVDPAEYLAELLVSVSTQERCWAAMGPYFLLKSLRMRHDGDASAYRSAAAPWQRRYATSVRALASHLESLVGQGRLPPPAEAAPLGPAVLRERAAAVERDLGG